MFCVVPNDHDRENKLTILKGNFGFGVWTTILFLWDFSVFAGYPSARCNDDDMIIFLFVMHLLYVCIWICCHVILLKMILSPPSNTRTTMTTDEEIIRRFEAIMSRPIFSDITDEKLDIIKTATKNLKKKKKIQVPDEKIHVYLTNEEDIESVLSVLIKFVIEHLPIIRVHVLLAVQIFQ
mmetsp:Transcript_870/g.1074  ORF Transcript_870/g.1074 Transcript_870/m.1074 type:complete len:180 (-) Transcript_870:122-661(-)